MHQKIILFLLLFLLSSNMQYHKTWVFVTWELPQWSGTCGNAICGKVWMIYSLILDSQTLKYLSILQMMSNIWTYQKRGWETSCVWCITFLLAVPSPATPIIGLQPTSVCFPSLQNYCVGQKKHLASGIILLWYCTLSLMSLFFMWSLPLCNHVQTCSYGLK